MFSSCLVSRNIRFIADIVDPVWPDGDYSIPMSVYGCGNMAENQWLTGYLNISFKYPVIWQSSRNADNNRRPPSLLLGPHGQFSYQLNFCTKHLNRTAKIPDPLSAWPRGNYSIFGSRRGCPAGSLK